MLEQMLKLMGIDPESMGKDIADFKEMAQTFSAAAKDMQARLARIEAHLGVARPAPDITQTEMELK